MSINLSGGDRDECRLQRLVLNAALSEQESANTLQDERPKDFF